MPEPSEVGRAIARERNRRGWGVRELGRRADVHYSHISKLERGDVQYPGADILKKIAAALDVAPEDLLGQVKPTSAPPAAPRFGPVILVPVVNITLAAGGAVFGETQETVPLSADLAPAGHQLVASRVSGNCMEPDLRDGDMVIIDVTNRSPHPGQMVAVLMEDGNMLIKRFVHRNGEILLEDNQGQQYRPNGAKIQGTAIQRIQKLP